MQKQCPNGSVSGWYTVYSSELAEENSNNKNNKLFVILPSSSTSPLGWCTVQCSSESHSAQALMQTFYWNGQLEAAVVVMNTMWLVLCWSSAAAERWEGLRVKLPAGLCKRRLSHTTYLCWQRCGKSVPLHNCLAHCLTDLHLLCIPTYILMHICCSNMHTFTHTPTPTHIRMQQLLHL